MNARRTDLALEAHALFRAAQRDDAIDGLTLTERTRRGCAVTTVTVEGEAASRALGQAARDLRHARPARAFSRGPRVHGARGARAPRRAARSPRRNGRYRPRGRTRQPRHDARRHRSPRRRSCARHAPPEGLRRLRCARGCQRADARRPRHNGIGGRRARARRGGDRAPRPCRCRRRAGVAEPRARLHHRPAYGCRHRPRLGRRQPTAAPSRARRSAFPFSPSASPPWWTPPRSRSTF